MKEALKFSLVIFFLYIVFASTLLKNIKSLYCGVVIGDRSPILSGCSTVTTQDLVLCLGIVYIISAIIFFLVDRDNEEPHILSQENIDVQIATDALTSKKINLKKKILFLLERHNFLEADTLYLENKSFLKGEVDEVGLDKFRGELIQDYFSLNFFDKNILNNTPDTEQAEAIGALGQYVLVSARAGSGKTDTISGKVAYLCQKYEVSINEIMVLCFNSEASSNMKKRINRLIPRFENARTFHSWAFSIVSPGKESLLFDDKMDGGEEFSRKEYSNFVKDLIQKHAEVNQDFKKSVYYFFREEAKEVDESISETKLFKNEDDRYSYLRNLTYVTLNGTRVKSRGEKFIADFLFEHNIEFYYEQSLSWNKVSGKSYHPDFTIKSGNDTYVLEHWGIDEKDRGRSVPSHWTKTWSEYKDEMEQKREFFRTNNNYKFIQTSISDINYRLPYDEQRKDFELVLKNRLEDSGIECIKLSEDQRIDSVWDKQLFSRMDNLVGQFISWMQKLEWTESDLLKKINEGNYTTKQVMFCKMGLSLYNEYLTELERLNKIDFNILVSKAAEKIRSGEFDVSNLKYLLIDEFQDFSKLFQNLVEAITTQNPECKLFCVGDSWQLINGFAGSELKYFEEFQNKAVTKTISTCYRSDRSIIDGGNQFAEIYKKTFPGQRSKYFSEKVGENVLFSIEDVSIENDYRSRVVDHNFKQPFRKISKNNKEYFSYESAQYLKLCYEIVKENQGKTVLLLCRNNQINGFNIQTDLCKPLVSLLKKENIPTTDSNGKSLITFKTIHSSKGLESDVVIMLYIYEKILPSIHPSSNLFEVFGRTPERILDEEKKLYYVGITRAKEKLYTVTSDRPSEFIIDRY